MRPGVRPIGPWFWLISNVRCEHLINSKRCLIVTPEFGFDGNFGILEIWRMARISMHFGAFKWQFRCISMRHSGVTQTWLCGRTFPRPTCMDGAPKGGSLPWHCDAKNAFRCEFGVHFGVHFFLKFVPFLFTYRLIILCSNVSQIGTR